MASTDPTRKLAISSRTRKSITLIFVVLVVIVFGARFSESLKGSDFPDFYCAARMLADGHGHQLYDAELQRQYQARYTGRVGTLYIHPPFEAELYLTAAWLPLRLAFLLWSALNLIFVTVALRCLAKDALAPWDWSHLLIAGLIFVPLILCFQQGQDSGLLLMLVTLAFSSLRKERGFAAGAWLGLSLFKFQIAVPLIIVLLLTQNNTRKEMAKGFAAVAVALAGLSAAVSGWSVVTVYPEFLLHLRAQPFAGVAPHAMANFRGLIDLVFHNEGTLWSAVAVSIASMATLIKVVNDWKDARLESNVLADVPLRFDIAFANTVLFALLVSYHLNPHDISLLLLPIFLLLHHLTRPSQLAGPAQWTLVSLLIVLFLPLLHLILLRIHLYALVSIPIAACFFLSNLHLARISRITKSGT